MTLDLAVICQWLSISTSPKMKVPPLRFWIAVMIFFTTFTNYMLRANISVSIIKMVDRKGKNFTPPCKKDEPVANKTGNKTEAEDIYVKYKWTENEVGLILGAYFWGYIVTVIPGGVLAEMLGPWHTILWSSLLGGICTGLTPICAEIGPWGVIVNRFIVGLVGGVAYPAVNVLIAKWAPPKEKGKFLAAMMGNTLGTVISFNLVGIVTSQWGWPWGFYVLVILMGTFCLAFGILAADSPQRHPWISEAEKNYIVESQEGHVSTKKKIAPYAKILTSFPFWILCIAQFGNLWGLNLILTYAPKFMSETLGFDLKASAGLAALPNLARLFASQIFGVVGDWIVKKEKMSVTKSRKFFIIFSHFLPALCVLLIPTSGCDPAGVVSLLVLSQLFNGAVVVSHLINPQDLAPNFSGTVYGMMNFVGMITGILVPPITGALNSYYHMELTAAAIIFSIGGVMFAVCGVFFVLFAKCEVQPWNEIRENE